MITTGANQAGQAKDTRSFVASAPAQSYPATKTKSDQSPATVKMAIFLAIGVQKCVLSL
jgi:hypothetical protein